MKKGWIVLIIVIVALFIIIGWVVGKYNTMQKAQVDVQTQWAQVQAAYQRRFDLIPNLVATVQGAANFEKSTLTAVTEARAKMGGQINLPPNAVNDPKAFANFQQMQDGLGSALSRLMVVVEKYPELKANQNYLALQDQLESTENRINQERRIYNDTAKMFNKMVVTFPNVFFARMFGLNKAELFQGETAAQKAPTVKFE